MTKKIQVSFSDKQVDLLEILKGEMGDSDADVVRSIVISWLAEKGLIADAARRKALQHNLNCLNQDNETKE